MEDKNTKIICTLGPSSNSITEIESLVSSGMNIARLNFSHGTAKEHSEVVSNIRKIEKKRNQRITIIQDLQGPKIRIGEMPDKGIMLKQGETTVLRMEDFEGFKDKNIAVLPVQYKNLINDVKSKDRILINDGLIELEVFKKEKKDIFCKVRVAGLVTAHKGINVPTASISVDVLTEKDKKDLKLGIKLNVDYIALSFVKNANDIKNLRNLIGKSNIKIIAKIERHEAIKNLEEIIQESDALMVARGDLGVEIPFEQVPVIQKRLIRLANEYRKPVITATQVLQSMIENPRATRAEISDAANAIYDRTDAIMLSNESAVGKYAQKAVQTLKKVALEVEKDLEKNDSYIKNIQINHKESPTNAMCYNAAKLAKELDAKFIIAYTDSGYTARELTKPRFFTPIITITPYEKVARELGLVYSINKIIVKKITGKPGERTQKIVNLLKKEKLVKKDDQIVIISNASKMEKLVSTYKI